MKHMTQHNIQPKWIAVLCAAALLSLSPVLMGAVHPKAQADIVSWFVADMDHDSEDELLVITGSHPGALPDTGEAYGDCVKLYSDFEIKDDGPVLKGGPDASFDLSGIKPFKIQAGDINGDGVMEIAVCVYKTTKFHPVPAKRPFFYGLAEGGAELEPVWLGSRLSRPFDQYILNDMDGDGMDEIVSIEQSAQGNPLFAVYDWKGFGFEVKAVSDELIGDAAFLNNKNRKDEQVYVSVGGKGHNLLLENSRLVFTDICFH